MSNKVRNKFAASARRYNAPPTAGAPIRVHFRSSSDWQLAVAPHLRPTGEVPSLRAEGLWLGAKHPGRTACRT
jgi:hypothetical protein